MANTPLGQIVAMGGGGFLMEPDNPLLDDYVLSLAPKTPARVCFIPTASGEVAASVARFYRAFSGKCIPNDLTLFHSPVLARRPAHTRDLEAFVAEHDIFYVGGGNTVNMLALWRAHGLDQLLVKAWRSGAILSGVSAGMICWFEASLTDSFGGLDPLNDGLGLLEGSACPHYDGESERRPCYHRAITEGLPAGYAADDGAALHFKGRNFVGAVSSRPRARAYRVAQREGAIVEDTLETRYLGR